MNVQRFIDRPILSIVISATILLIGFIGLSSLPVEQYPDIAPPTVMVSASYTGANAETIQKSVIVPLEESINGVENMTYMTSEATNTGDATINGCCQCAEPRKQSYRSASIGSDTDWSYNYQTTKQSVKDFWVVQ